MKKKRKRYRKQCPGENEGITEEMRFVAMRLRNIKGKKVRSDSVSDSETDIENTPSDQEREDSETVKSGENGGDGEAETWSPTMEGFLKYLVDSKLVFNTIERIVDESDDVACQFSFFSWQITLQKNGCFWLLFFFFFPHYLGSLFYILLCRIRIILNFVPVPTDCGF